jgi:hypothetical protein
LPYNRKAIAPWSTEREQGIESATVDSNIETPQYLQPVVNTGTIDLNGNWIGNATSDRVFKIDAEHLGIANGGDVLVPQAQPDFIDMTGYSRIFIALKPSNGGGFAIQAVMGPDTNTFANLTPVNAAALLKGSNPAATGNATSDLFNDGAEALTADVWNIFVIGGNTTTGELAGQKNMQFKITNNSGGASNITFAYLRVV